uniref:Uncharacterized protein n=1 Tax=Anguilla anguilla TaxID=7936 RepID=A0A0E9RTN4_ANGAN
MCLILLQLSVYQGLLKTKFQKGKKHCSHSKSQKVSLACCQFHACTFFF